MSSHSSAVFVEKRILALICLACVCYACIEFLIFPGRLFGDGVYYHQMSLYLTPIQPFPWGLRILTPFIVGTLCKYSGVSNDLSFAILMFAAITINLYILGRIVTLIGFDRHYTFCTIALTTATYWYIPFYIQTFRTVDSLNYLFISLLFLYGIKRKPFAYVLILIIGLFNKETILLCSPIYYIVNTSRSDLNCKYLYQIFRYLGCSFIILFLYRYSLCKLLGVEVVSAYLSNIDGRTPLEQMIFDLSRFKTFASVYLVYNFLWIITSILLIYNTKKINYNIDRLLIYFFCIALMTRPFTDAPRAFALICPFLIVNFLHLCMNFDSRYMRSIIIIAVFAHIFIQFQYLSQPISYFVDGFVVILFLIALEFYKDNKPLE